ncbi:MAG TPA: hypothetical protein VK508_04020 [Cyclobacteriaceae bacterium]|nr:hypothetical protein [Cyclobacteriaceae bacterium]
MIDQQTAYSEEIYSIKEKTTVILSKPWGEITEGDKQQLQKILQAVRLSIASVRIAHQSVLDLTRLKPVPARVIYFGDPVPGLAQFECIQATGTVVLAPHLDLLPADDAGRKKLWIALKQMFGL